MRKSVLVATLLLVPGISLMSPRTPHYLPLTPIAHAQDAAPVTDADATTKAFGVLEKHCISCHAEGKRPAKQAAIDKDSWKKLVEEQKKVVPTKPEESSVYTRMIDHEDPMPPKKVEVRPTAEEIALVKDWITRGAPNWKVEAK